MLFLIVYTIEIFPSIAIKQNIYWYFGIKYEIVSLQNIAEYADSSGGINIYSDVSY